jgi:Cu/Ag efflux protein CusF
MMAAVPRICSRFHRPFEDKTMKTTQIALATLVTITLAGASTAFGQQVRSGVIAKVDEPAGKITVRENGGETTVGGTNAGRINDFRLQDGLLFNALRYGDRVVFTVEDINGTKTITWLEEK